MKLREKTIFLHQTFFYNIIKKNKIIRSKQRRKKKIKNLYTENYKTLLTEIK